MVLEDREGVDEVSVEESEEEEVRGDGGLGQLQAGDMGQAGHCGEEGGGLPGIESCSLAL